MSLLLQDRRGRKGAAILALAPRIGTLLDHVLAEYSRLTGARRFLAELLYWYGLGAGIIDERHMAGLFAIFRGDPIFPRWGFVVPENQRSRSAVVTFAKSGDTDVARFALASVPSIASHSYAPSRSPLASKRDEVEIARRCIDFAKDNNDVWQPKYVEAMASLRLQWSVNPAEWLAMIGGPVTEELELAWCEVIRQAGYVTKTDRDSLTLILVRILESSDVYSDSVRCAAWQRLFKLVSSAQALEFAEGPLGLPLTIG